jgi:hypothetical protein
MKQVSDIPVWVQGGIGVHNAAAVVAIGVTRRRARQPIVALSRMRSTAAFAKNMCTKLNGNETRVIDNFRVLVRPNSPILPAKATRSDLAPFLNTLETDKGYLPLGQDIAIGTDLFEKYKKLPRLIFGIREAMHGHLRQAQTNQSAGEQNNPLAQALGTHYPIAQGAYDARERRTGSLPRPSQMRAPCLLWHYHS